jgi:hypothetical protein
MKIMANDLPVQPGDEGVRMLWFREKGIIDRKG